MDRIIFLGALVASVLATLIGRRHPLLNPNGDLPSFKFVILVSGFTPRVEPYESLFKAAVNTPSLHVFGENDITITPDLSRSHASCYSKPTLLIHEGGHFIPSQAVYKNQIVDFIKQFSTDPLSNLPGKL